VAQPIERNETKDVNNEMQYARPTKDIPGPKALLLLGNWFRFLTYTDKSSLVKVFQKTRIKIFILIFIIIELFKLFSNLNMMFIKSEVIKLECRFMT